MTIHILAESTHFYDPERSLAQILAHVWQTVLGLTGLLALAVAMVPAANRLHFPYTVLLAILGGVIGVIGVVVGDAAGLGVVGDFLQALEGLEISSDAILFVFLPTLVFESALSIDVRRLMDDIGPILLLAVIGLLISTVVVGYTLWVVTGVTLFACLLLGAIVSATDPVAVVAIFKDLGAPKRLAILVEGESLFNDATAIVLFTILAAMMTGGSEPGVLAGIWTFVKVFTGGILVGYVCARLVCYFISRLHNLPLVDVTLTISTAYLSFILAEHYLHVSGVMAVVTAALVVGSTGRTSMLPEAWRSLTETWEQLGFWANSLIFVLVGIIVPKILLSAGIRELGFLLILVVAAFAARASVLYGVLPLLSRVGLAERVSTEYTAMMLWGGLRGAVSLALALAIIENPAVPPDIQRFIVILVTGFVLFTLFINATTMRPMLALLGLDRLPPAEIAVRDRAMALSLSRIGESIGAIAEGYGVDPAISHRVVSGYAERVETVGTALRDIDDLSQEDWIRIGLTALAHQERREYLDQFAKGYVSSTIARLLLSHVDDLLDGLKGGGTAGYRRTVEKLIEFGWQFRVALFIHRRFGWTHLLTNRLVNRFETLTAKIAVLNSIITEGVANVIQVVGDEIGARTKDIIEDRLALVRDAMEVLDLQYPEYSRTLQQCHLGRIAVRLEEANYKSLFDHAVISKEVFSDLEVALEKRLRDLAQLPQLDLGLKPQQLVARLPYFESLDPPQIAEIAKILNSRLALPGEQIIRKGDRGKAMFFIVSGAVEVERAPHLYRLGSGDFFGEIALVNQDPRNANVTAKVFCDLLVLYTADFRTFLAAHPDLERIIYRVAKERLDQDLTT